MVKQSQRLQSIDPRWLGILAVLAMSIVLRPAATSVGPVLAEIITDLNASGTVAGLLTALPGFSFAMVGLTASRLAPRFGLTGSLLLASGLITAGVIARVLTGSWVLFLVFSFVALAGMAIANILLPAFIKVSFPYSSAQISTLFTTFLSVGAILPTVFVSPLTRVGDDWLGGSGGWRLAIGVWAVLGLVAMLVWVWVRRVCFLPKFSAFTARSVSFRQLLKSPTTIGLTLFFGTQSMQAYIQFGWAAQAYRDGGLSQTASAMMVTIMALGGIPGGLLMPRVVAGRRGLRPLIVFFAVLLAVGYLGIALAPTTWPWLWALALSISGFCFPTALALIIDRTEDPSVTTAVSAFVQSFGYFLAAAGPLLVGVAYQLIGSWPPILMVLAGTSVPLLAAGLVASRPRLIDTEVAGLD